MSTDDSIPSFNIDNSSTPLPFYKSWIGIVCIIVFLALIGINIFLYLAKGTQLLANISKKILSITASISKSILSESAIGVQQTTQTVNQTLDKLEQNTNPNPNPNQNPNPNPNPNQNPNPNPNPTPITSIQKSSNTQPNLPEPMDSEMLSGYPSTGPGYCYIGEEKGYRTCVEIGQSDKCMSGEIFPTSDICIHPNLRQ